MAHEHIPNLSRSTVRRLALSLGITLAFVAVEILAGVFANSLALLTDAVHNAIVLEFLARLASETLRLNPKLKPMQPALLDKHFLRKHGPRAYYGQA